MPHHDSPPRHGFGLGVLATRGVEFGQALRNNANCWVVGVCVLLVGRESLHQVLLSTFVVALSQAQSSQQTQHIRILSPRVLQHLLSKSLLRLWKIAVIHGGVVRLLRHQHQIRVCNQCQIQVSARLIEQRKVRSPPPSTPTGVCSTRFLVAFGDRALVPALAEEPRHGDAETGNAKAHGEGGVEHVLGLREHFAVHLGRLHRAPHVRKEVRQHLCCGEEG
mmetsp:Transcript_20285/g.48392  ORF Transcript_20285/g.48392 Transcript_20285/m.48392 type:complete len:221 (-) Transcript_20285:682-1344(-)